MALYRETGVVLRTIRLGEADRIVTLLTEGRGKVRAVAKGVRKTKSRFGGRLEPVTHVSLQLYEGRELDTITQAETLDAFRVIREDLDRLAKATALLEVCDQVSQQGEANPGLYRMLVAALRTLAARSSPLLVAGFFLKLLAQEGVHPVLDACASCGSPAGDADLVAFDIGEGGALCRSCRRGTPVSPAALGLLRLVLGGGLNRVLGEPAGPLASEVDALATRAMEQHLERRLRAANTTLGL